MYIRYQYCFPRYDNIATLLSSPNVGPARTTPKPLKYPHSKNNSRRPPNIYNLGRQFLLKQIASKQITPKQIASKQIAPKQIASKQIAPKQIASKQFASKQIASKQIASKQIASEHVLQF